MPILSNRRATTALFILATVLTGLIWRNAPLHLPFFLWKYGGSCLWAVAVYWFLAFLLPNARPVTLATLSCLFALAVELSRLVQWPPLGAFRLTLAGRLILGSIFSPRNIAAYWLAILAIAFADSALQPGRRSTQSKGQTRIASVSASCNLPHLAATDPIAYNLQGNS